MSLGKDLASIRQSQNLTLEDIQNAIKIPLTTLKSIENGSIFSDPNNNRAYIRSFVRSYAKALKLDDEQIVQALDEMEAGTYTGASLFGEEPSAQEEAKQEQDESTTDHPVDKENKAAASPKKDKPVSAEKPEAEAAAPKKETDANQEPINWADLSRQFGTPGKSASRTWVAIVVIVLMLALGGAGIYFWFTSSNSAERTPTEMEETTQIDDNFQQNIPPPITADTSASETEITNPEETSPAPTNEPSAIESTEITELDDTLTLSVYAAYGQLEPVRVTSDLNWRTNPFWMEQGEAYYFDFKDTLLVRGQYSRMLLLFNGHVIENPRQNNFDTSFNSIMITRSVLNNPKYLAPAPSEFPLDVGAPDSIIYRIRL